MIDQVEHDLGLYLGEQEANDLYTDEFDRVEEELRLALTCEITAVLSDDRNQIIDHLFGLADNYGTDYQTAIVNGLKFDDRMALAGILNGGEFTLGQRARLAGVIAQNFDLTDAVKARIEADSKQAQEDRELREVE